MPNTLGGVTLPNAMYLDDTFNFTGTASVLVRTIGGGLVVQSNDVYSGRNIILVAGERTGWITKTVLDSLLTLASVKGATYTLSFDSTSYTVMFDDSDGSPFEVEPLVPRPSPEGTDYYIGKIKLIEV